MDPLQVITEALDVLDPHRVDNAERAAVVAAAIHAKGFTVIRDVALPELETV